MTRAPALDQRWTRMCFCGQQTAAGPGRRPGQFGLPQLTGSEEGRGPLFDVTRDAVRGPDDRSDLGDRRGTRSSRSRSGREGGALAAVRIGDRLIVTVPGEMTEEMGRRLRASVLAASAGAGIRRVVISGLANEYMDYFTTPEEYDTQHYEGGSTVYGRTASLALQDGIDALAHNLADGGAPPEPYDFDLTNGITPDGSQFPTGADSATVVSQPPRTKAVAFVTRRSRGRAGSAATTARWTARS